MTRSMLVLPTLALLLVPTVSSAQIGKRIGRAVGRAAESEATRQLEQRARDGVRCVFDDLECIDKANASGKGTVLTDDRGNVMRDADGNPISDPGKARAAAGSTARPGEGAWANYDFVPGDSILFYEDFSRDRVGDFPRRFELVQGNWEIVDWEGSRYLRATSGGLVAIPLPQDLPERFTLEFSVNLTHGNAYARMMTGQAYYGQPRSYTGSAVAIEYGRAGIRPVAKEGPMAITQTGDHRIRDEIMPVRVMGDGDYLKVYLDERRVANVPNAVFPRSDKLYLAVGSATDRTPILIGPIRVAKADLDLYDRLERDGRAATQGILFGYNSARIRPESTPTLEEIARMLDEHPDLRLGVEGHTDADGDDSYNQKLSEERAAAVKAYLVDRHRISGDRLTTSGYGESRPAASNNSPEGKQQNRRVELVRLPG